MAPNNTNRITNNTPDLRKLEKEYKQRLKYASMNDHELYHFTIEALKASFQERDYPFHPNHTKVDRVREEWDRRKKPTLFNKAFNKI